MNVIAFTFGALVVLSGFKVPLPTWAWAIALGLACKCLIYQSLFVADATMNNVMHMMHLMVAPCTAWLGEILQALCCVHYDRHKHWYQ